MTLHQEIKNKNNNKIANTNKSKLKKYLIAIKSDNGAEEHITISGDSYRPFQIAHNLWNYITPWTAARKLESLAKSWEAHNKKVERIYGTILDMQTTGNEFNIGITITDFIN